MKPIANILGQTSNTFHAVQRTIQLLNQFFPFIAFFFQITLLSLVQADLSPGVRKYPLLCELIQNLIIFWLRLLVGIEHIGNILFRSRNIQDALRRSSICLPIGTSQHFRLRLLGTKHGKQQTEQSFGSIKIFKAMNGYLWIFFFFFLTRRLRCAPFGICSSKYALLGRDILIFHFSFS